MDKQYYKDYYHFEREHWWYKARMNILQSCIETKIGKSKTLKILNVGTATGATSTMLQQFGHVTSIEYDKDCCEFVNSMTNLNVQQGDITKLQFAENSFDLVCAFDVIEHVMEDKKAASELLRVCNSGGFVFVTTPAFQFLWSEHDVVNHHIKRYTSGLLRGLFLVENKNIIFKSYFNSLLFLPIAGIRILTWPLQKLKQKNNAKVESDFSRYNSSFLGNMLYKLFMTEKYLLKFIRFPFGVSIALMLKK